MIGYVRGILDRTCLLLRIRCRQWRDKRTLARLQRISVALGADRLLSSQVTQQSPSPGEPAFITEVAEELRLPPLLCGDGTNLIKALCGELRLEDQPLSCETALKALAEREAQLIAEYDAHFLASIRIKSPVRPFFG